MPHLTKLEVILEARLRVIASSDTYTKINPYRKN